jgi:hypothetical protein
MDIPVRLVRKGGNAGEQQAGIRYGRLVGIVYAPPEDDVFGVVIIESGSVGETGIFRLVPLDQLRAVNMAHPPAGTEV